MADFVPGVELSRAFYDEVISAAIDGVHHSAALLGTGSDVLGLDTQRSTDHGWGPRLQLFVEPEDVPRVMRSIEAALPDEFRGWPTSFGWDDVPVTHHVEVVALREWLLERLGFDPRDGVSLVHWLGTPQQILLEVTRGAVHRDDSGELAAVRSALAWYPEDVWLWLLACQWRRIDQEEPFVGRTDDVGDDLGSRIVAARLVRDIVRLCFLMERCYAPYSKWLGTSFKQLVASEKIGDSLLAVLEARDFAAREEALVSSLQSVASAHNSLGITRHVGETVGMFHSRPFRVLGSGRFVDACLERIADPKLRALPLVGGIDQFVDSADTLSYPNVARRIDAFYGVWLA